MSTAKFSTQEINQTAFTQKLKRGESHLEMRSAEGEIWIPDLYISNMKTFTNTGFVDHPGIKMDVDKYKTIYYSRSVRQELSAFLSVKKCHSCTTSLLGD